MRPQPITPTLPISMVRPPGKAAARRLLPSPRTVLPMLSGSARSVPDRLEQDRDSLAAADARRGDRVASGAPPQLQERRQDEPRSRGAERMAERDRSAVDVHALAVELERLFDREILSRERLVDLEKIDLLQRDPRPREKPLDGGRRTDPHDARLDADHLPGGDASERGPAGLLRHIGRSDDDRRAAVDDPAGVAGGHEAVLAER